MLFFVLKARFSKWGCSSVPGNDKASCRNVCMEIIYWLLQVFHKVNEAKILEVQQFIRNYYNSFFPGLMAVAI
jgi:hypothetical protein